MRYRSNIVLNIGGRKLNLAEENLCMSEQYGRRELTSQSQSSIR